MSVARNKPPAPLKENPEKSKTPVLNAPDDDKNGGNSIFQKSPVLAIFEDELQAEIFNARCHDTVEKAKIFKEEFLRLNMNKNKAVLNLTSMRLGVNSIISLSNLLQRREQTIEILNLADNSISDYGMHAVKTIISQTEIKSLNLSSNMISEAGLEMIVDDLIKNIHLKTLDLGVVEGSIRKNSLGVDGAKCLAAIILHNKTLESIKLQDNDINISGGEIIGAALKQNRTLKALKLAENNLKTEGAEFIIKNGMNLESIDLGKNYLGTKMGLILKTFLETSAKIKKINIEYNELFALGTDYIAQGIRASGSLRALNIRGNAIRDEGIECIAEALLQNRQVEELDVSLNEITPLGQSHLSEVIAISNLLVVNISKNLLGDESIIYLADNLKKYEDSCRLNKIDFSSCRIGDGGILYFLEKTETLANFQHIRANDNFISEKIEKFLLDILAKNKTLVEFSLQGNRLSVCCLNKVKKLMRRNAKELEDKEPNKLKTEIYRLKYEQKKIIMAKEKLKNQEKEISKIEEQKNNMTNELERLKLAEHNKRQNMTERIEEQRNMIEKKKQLIYDKQEDFRKLKEKHLLELEELAKELENSHKRKVDIEQELVRVNKEIEEQEEYYGKIITDLMGSIAQMKEKSEDLEKKTQELNEEYRALMKLEQEKLEKKNSQILQENLNANPEALSKKKSTMKKKATVTLPGPQKEG